VYCIFGKSFIYKMVNGLSAMFLVSALSLLVVNVGSAFGDSVAVGKAAKRSARHGAKRSAPAGVVFGGVTSAGSPVVIQVSQDGRQIVRATMAVPQKCQLSGATFFTPDDYIHVPITATGAFHSSGEWSAPLTEPPVTGVTSTSQLSGTFNRAMTALTGTWSLVSVFNGATGTAVDRCDSGSLSFTAIQ